MKEDLQIITDTREQKTWWPEEQTTRGTLKTGDYSLAGHETVFALERKSMADICQTVTTGHERFGRELVRASEMRYFAIMIEGSVMDLLNKKWPQSYRTKVTGQAVVAILATLSVKYDIKIFFCGGKAGAKHLAKKIMKSYLQQVAKGKYNES